MVQLNLISTINSNFIADRFDDLRVHLTNETAILLKLLDAMILKLLDLIDMDVKITRSDLIRLKKR